MMRSITTVWSCLLVLLGVACLHACTPSAVAESRRKAAPVQARAGEELATFAGGCFWCMEPPFESVAGVRSVQSGYTGGKEQNPSYKDVSAGRTGHTEAVQIVFDPKRISYGTLLEIYWRSMDPTDAGGQFADRGRQYRPGIFYHSAAQERAALASKRRLEASKRFGKPIAVELTRFVAFYPAEQYHQDYYRKHPAEYKRYRKGSGREGYLRRVWGDYLKVPGVLRYQKPAQATLRKRLTPLQYQVTQSEGTEPPFRNRYWNNKRPGIYVDVVSGEPLFSSRDKFKSGTGWPSFTRPLDSANVVERLDRSFGTVRREIRSKHGDSHLGHVFEDGPKPTGLRYCVNSAALRFVALEDLEREGYGHLRNAVLASSE